MRLFCFPYAGGSSAIFNAWRTHLSKDIELIPVELAGRGIRIRDPLYEDLQSMVDDVHSSVASLISKDKPYAFFGHSMGSLIAYRVCKKLQHEKSPPCAHAFFSGRRAPHIDRIDDTKFHLMEEADFKNELIRLGGTPPEFFNYPELANVFLPVLRNDFKITESALHETKVVPLECSVTVLLGKDEDVTAEEADGWKKHTKQVCSIHYFEGGHFFLHEHARQIVKLINNTLLSDAYSLRQKPSEENVGAVFKSA